MFLAPGSTDQTVRLFRTHEEARDPAGTERGPSPGRPRNGRLGQVAPVRVGSVVTAGEPLAELVRLMDGWDGWAEALRAGKTPAEPTGVRRVM